MKKTIAVKRSELLREWILAQYGNNENYYYSTLSTGIADGETMESVLNDLQDGFYDDDINETLDMYSMARKRYGKDGYYFNGVLYETPEQLFSCLGIVIPDRILKNKNYYYLYKNFD